MRKNQASLSALGIAVLRAVEMEKPAGERICEDPFARRFIPGWFYGFIRFFIRSGYAEHRGKGVMGFLVARDRYIDDYLAAQLKQGLDQLVILGAGYDSRAYRFDGLRPPIRVFEVDHPATQASKLDALRRIFGNLPEHVTYVPIDFNRQTLDECLVAHGYDPHARTVFIWQGVTYYLDAAAVDGTLSLIAHHAAPGSSVVFDFIDDALLKSAAHHGEVKGMKRYRGMTGEDLRFGIPLDQIDSFLHSRGFEQVNTIRSEDLKALYFSGKNQSRNVMSGYAIVSAVVSRHTIGEEDGNESEMP
jgi:methyltransferase (TIGR00027 family)